jgi:hypothetical protein
MAKAASASKLCFVVGPLGADDSDVRIHADWLLEEIIQPVMSEFPDFIVRRADLDHRPGLIDAQMINDLLTADLVIADLSGQNPNAFYEIGIRHMAQKPIIHMQLAGETVPFDVSLYRAIKFSRTRPKDIRTAREQLKLQVRAVLDSDYEVENPVTNARGRIKLDESATEPQRVILDRLGAIEAKLASSSSGGSRLSGLDDQLAIEVTFTSRTADSKKSDLVKLVSNMTKDRSSFSESIDGQRMLLVVPRELSRVVMSRVMKLAEVGSVREL